ncbi:MAG TPA: hypothetical protein VN809_01685, partial [Telmatospirillum sp.]|nr:hypothetical protein [Telmatospirillum sp.]
GLITAGDQKTDTLCFACHNGQIAFKKCAGCHRDLSEPVAHAQPATTATVATPPAIVPLIYEGATTIGKSFVPVK